MCNGPQKNIPSLCEAVAPVKDWILITNSIDNNKNIRAWSRPAVDQNTTGQFIIISITSEKLINLPRGPLKLFANGKCYVSVVDSHFGTEEFDSNSKEHGGYFTPLSTGVIVIVTSII